MRRFRLMLLSCLLLVSGAAHAADPAGDDEPRPPGEDSDMVRFGITAPFHPRLLGKRFGLGLGWSLPQRWYDTDGQLLTERSLLNPGDDLERSGFYFALRF